MDIIPQLVANSIIAGSIYAILALGFSFIYGTVRFFDLGYGALTAVGGYSTFYLMRTLELPTSMSVVGGVLTAGIVGYLIYLFVYAPLRRREATNMVLLVAALGVLTVVQAVVAILFSSQFRVLSRNVGTQPTYDIFGGIITQTQLIILLVAVLLTIGLALLLGKTRFGQAVRAIGDSEEVSKIVGINTGRVTGVVFFIGSAIAGLAGILVGFDIGIEPTMGLSLLLKGVIAAIIGGIGNIYGAVAGAFLLGFVENFGIWKIPGEWKDAIAFGLLIIFLLFRPEGIFKR